MTRTRWILGGALLAGGALAALLFATLGQPRRGAAPATVAEEPATSAPSTLAEPAATAQATDGEATRAPLDAGASAPPPPAPSEEKEFRWVELVEAGTERPVPGAEVWYRDWDGSWNPLAFERLVGQPDTRHAVADERGRARVIWPASSSVLVLARTGELCGGGPVVPPSTPAEVARVELQRDWGVLIEVVDTAGKPVPRVPIALELRRSGFSARENLETDDDGRAAYRHVGMQFALQRVPSLLVRVALPLAEPLQRRLEQEAPPDGPIRFQLPASGAVAVTLLDGQGRAVQDETHVQLGLVLPGETRDVSPFARERERMDAQTVGGRALFEHVVLGAELELVVMRARSSEKDYFPGPARAGERVERTVVVGRDHPVLVFRALDEAQAPLADAELALVLDRHSSSMRNRDEDQVESDAEGRFELELVEPYDGETRTLRVEANEGALGALVDLSRPFEPGRVAMGDLVLAGAPVVAQGRVLDARGAGVAGANVRIELGHADEAGRVEYWESTDLTAVSDAQGAFALRSFTEAARVRVWADLAERRSDLVEADAGAGGLVLSLLTTGALAGSVLLGPGVPADALVLTAVRTEPGAYAGEDGGRPPRVQPNLDGSFRWDALLPGRHTVTLALEEDSSELVRIEDVVVRSGETNADARLQGLDLRARLHAIRLVLHAPAGSGELEGQVTFHASERNDTVRGHWFQGAVVELVSPWERIDATLTVPGYRLVALPGLSGEREVELAPALPVRLVLPSSIVLPEPPVFLKAALVGGDDAGIDWGVPAFDAARELACLAPEAGRLRVCWIVERRSGGGASATLLGVEPPEFVEVREQASEQRFELTSSNEALQRALAASSLR